MRGPHITPGYWRQPELTRAAFDEEGFYKIGDALKFADPGRSGQGLLFDGRIAEDFKLATGTWVSVGPLRARFIDHFAPFAQDVVIAGSTATRSARWCSPTSKPAAGSPVSARAHRPTPIVERREVRALSTSCSPALAAQRPAARRASPAPVLLAEPPSIDRGEITDKGSINQRAVLTQPRRLVEELYASRYPSRHRVDG